MVTQMGLCASVRFAFLVALLVGLRKTREAGKKDTKLVEDEGQGL